MGLRLTDTTVTTDTSNVIPLWANETSTDGTSPEDDSLPEPTTLYGLIALAFLLHTPTTLGRWCVRCAVAWPCDHLRLAYQPTEGF